MQQLIQNDKDDKEVSELDSNSAKALVKSKQENPLNLYERAIKAYKDKKIDIAVSQFKQALALFEAKSGKESKECFKCYSALISCYRDVQQYDQTIELAETAITIFYGKIDNIDPIIKKYHEVLKLKNIDVTVLYNQAISNYKERRLVLRFINCYTFRQLWIVK